MRIPTLLIITVLSLVMLPALSVQAGSTSGSSAAAGADDTKPAAKKKAKRKRCRKGYVLKTVKVKRKGKLARVKRCRKKAKQRKQAAPKPQTTAPKAPGPTTPAPSAPQPLFEPPGMRLEGAAAQPFLDRYLTNSRFTDCPAGPPSCAVEQRYSHTGITLISCKLPKVADADFAVGYAVETASVEPDGSWTFDAVAQTLPRTTFFHWTIAIDGTVTGSYKVPGPTLPVPIGPLQYVAGAHDCNV